MMRWLMSGVLVVLLLGSCTAQVSRSSGSNDADSPAPGDASDTATPDTAQPEDSAQPEDAGGLEDTGLEDTAPEDTSATDDPGPADEDTTQPHPACIGVPPGSECELDDDQCTLEFCNGSGACVTTGQLDTCEGAAAQKPCWSWTCSASKGCVQTSFIEGTACNDGNPCSTNDLCTLVDGSQELCVGNPIPVDDGNSCTDDTCTGGDVTHSPLSGSPCDAGGSPGLCDEGACVPDFCGCASDSDCDDATACTEDTCVDCTCSSMPIECQDGLVCVEGECTDISGPECGEGWFCPTADTTLSGAVSTAGVLIPEGVTVTCTGVEPLEITSTGPITILGTLQADGAPGGSSSVDESQGACGGWAGGDGYRDCTSSCTTFCESSTQCDQKCLDLIGPAESFAGAPCAYLAEADGQPGFGPGGGKGGQRSHPGSYNVGPSGGGGGGGGGGSHGLAGSTGAVGKTNICYTAYGGAPGQSQVAALDGGAGGGAGGMTRNVFGEACSPSGCGGGCTSWGGDGGSGGGVIRLTAPALTVSGLVSARGGDGGAGQNCGGAGGGGAGGSVIVDSASVIWGANADANTDLAGGNGGSGGSHEVCQGHGAGGQGGAGVLSGPGLDP